MTDILAAESSLPRRERPAARRVVTSDVDRGGGRSVAERTRARVLRIAIPLLAAAVIATTSMGASAASSSDTCDSATVVAHALSAIVNITSVRVSTGEDSAAGGKPGQERIAVFVGSGVVIDPSGIIVTNKHVIQGAALIRVIFNDRSDVPAQLIGAASLMDVALLKVNIPKPLPTLQFGDSDALRLGQRVIAVGNPLGIGTSVSTGVVSGLNRDLMKTPFDDFIQTDAAINPGNSGGPLLDCAGNVIGIDTELYSNSKVLGSIGLGFALPSNDVNYIASKLRNPEANAPNWIGLELQDLTAQLAKTFGRADMGGAIVTGVDPGSPAAKAAFLPGDVITSADGQELPDSRAILRAIVQKPSGEPMSLTVWRHGQSREATVVGQPWPHMMALRSDVLASAAAVARAQAEGLGLGMHLAAITAANRQHFGLGDTSGVLVDLVTPGSQAADLGLTAGDVIQQVGDAPAKVPADVMNRLAHHDTASGDLVPLLVRSKNKSWWFPIYVGQVDVSELVTAPQLPNQPAPARDAAAQQRR